MINPKIKTRAMHRARILEGQMRGLAKAIEREEYCVNLLLRSLSMQKSLQSLNCLLLENHLRTHVKHQMRHRGEEEKAVRELIKVYTLSHK